MSTSWKIKSEIQESRPPTPDVPLPYHKLSNGAAKPDLRGADLVGGGLKRRWGRRSEVCKMTDCPLFPPSCTSAPQYHNLFRPSLYNPYNQTHSHSTSAHGCLPHPIATFLDDEELISGNAAAICELEDGED